MRRRVGETVAANYRCFSPPLDDLSAYVDLGRTPQGVPVRVFRPVAEADLRILVGSVLPHLQAGFGGGYKLIFPGTSHRTTLGTLHRQGLEGQSGAAGLLGCDAADNPMRASTRRPIDSGRAGRSTTWGGSGEVFPLMPGIPSGCRIVWQRKRGHQAPRWPT
jgi:nickel-dependent lactate racemase